MIAPGKKGIKEKFEFTVKPKPHVIAFSPLGTWLGIMTFSWNNPGLINATEGFGVAKPEIQQDTPFGSVPVCVADPCTTVDVTPNPNATRMTVSPAFAGVDAPGKSVVGPRRL